MARHEICFAVSVSQGPCILDWIAAGQLCPSRKQSQPPPYFAALLVNRIVAMAVPADPISNHCHIAPMSFQIGNCAGNLVSHRSPKLQLPLVAPFLERQKFTILGNFDETFFLLTQCFACCGAVGCRILQQICGGRCQSSFLSRKVHVLASESSKNAVFGGKPCVNISGFLRQFCGNSQISKSVTSRDSTARNVSMCFAKIPYG